MTANTISVNIISEEEIRETIYNVMLELALSWNPAALTQGLTDPSTKNNIIKELLADTIKQMCSLYSTGFYTIRGNKVTLANVHPNFRELFTVIEKIAKPHEMKDENKYKHILAHLVETVSSNDIFKKIIQQLVIFYLESQKVIPSVITADMIRDTFYNIMVEQVIIKKMISISALIDMDSFVFYDLTAFVILDVVCASMNYKGILLHNQSIVTEANCPIEFKNFYLMASKLKSELSKLTKSEVELVKMCASSDPEKKLSPDDEKKKTRPVIKLITIIKDIAIQISQNENFREVISKVICFSIEAGAQKN